MQATRPLGVLILSGALVFAASAAAQAAPRPQLPDTTPVRSLARPSLPGVRYIVTFSDDVDVAEQVRLARTRGLRVGRTFTHALRGMEVVLTAAQRTELAADPHVLAIEKDAPVEASGTQTDPPWGLDRIDQRSASLDGRYTYPNTGSGVTIYVLDTGIATWHPEFTNRIVGGAYTYPSTVDGKYGDDNGHGTHVAGSAAGANVGVAKGAALYPIKVLDSAGEGTTADAVAGLDWVAAQHDPGERAVANLSLGGDPSDAVDDAVRSLIGDGVVVVVAAGNDGIDACGESPARVGTALTVAASGWNARDYAADFSNGGPCVDLYAPGVEVESAWPDREQPYKVLDGTSMAAPHVAGVAALMLNKNPSLTPLDVHVGMIGRASAMSPAPGRLLFASDASGTTTLTGPTPTVAGSATVGSTLRGAAGAWSPAGASLTLRYQWYRVDAYGPWPIEDATASTYRVTRADGGSRIRLAVTGYRPDATPRTLWSAMTAEVPAAPYTTEASYSIGGQPPVVGATVTAQQSGSWSPEPAVWFQWHRVTSAGSSSKIAGATEASYRVTSADAGFRIRLEAQAYLQGYERFRQVVTTAQAATYPPFATVSAPTISGTPHLDQTLTAQTGTWAPTPDGFNYQWYRVAGDGARSVLPGATGRTHKATTADVGQRLAVAVKGTKTGYQPATRVSAPTAVVTASAFTAAPAPTVGGTPRYGATVTAVTAGWAPPPDGFAYQWYRVASSGSRTVIPDARAATYRVAAADIGARLAVAVKAVKTGHLATTRVSGPSAVATAASFSAAPRPTVSGQRRLGATLAAVTSGWAPTPDGFAYQWYRVAGNGARTVIAGARARTYKAVRVDVGLSLAVAVKGVKSGYQPTTQVSYRTAVVTA